MAGRHPVPERRVDAMIRPQAAALRGQSLLKTNLQGAATKCPHCRLRSAHIRGANRRRSGFAFRLMASVEDEEEKGTKKCKPRGVTTLAERVSNSLRKLRHRDKKQKGMFNVPGHWMEQTGRLSKGERRKLETYYAVVAKVNAMEKKIEQLMDVELAEKTGDMKKRVHNGESLESILPEAFALVREAAKRVLEMRHYDCQLIGGIVLHEGQIAEMDTGEGKTLVATLAVYLNALKFSEVHVVTVNEYLAKRDAQWMGKIYSLLGLSVAAIEEDMTQDEKMKAYKANVVYVTAQQLCFDYLGDWTASSEHDLVLQRLNFAIVDEVDSILLDESRTPLILSAKAVHQSERVELAAKMCHEVVINQKYGLINKLVGLLETLGERGEDIFKGNNIAATDKQYLMDAVELLRTIIESTELLYASRNNNTDKLLEYLRSFGSMKALSNDPVQLRAMLNLLNSFKPDLMRLAIAKYDFQRKKVALTTFGARMFRETLEQQGKLPKGSTDVSIWESKAGEYSSAPWGHYLSNALKVIEFFTKGTEYIVSDGRVILVDEATGRTRSKSRYEEGLHQALEAKEMLLQDLEGRGNGEQPLHINPDNYTIASVTFQVFFRYYDKLAGMSGTAKVEQAEFFESYGLNVVRIPTHRPPRRRDHPPTIFTEPILKMEALVYELAKNGVRPILVGTNSVQESELVLSALKENWKFSGGHYELNWDGETRFDSGRLLTLNARPEVAKSESQIIAQAGLPSMVTIATKMAGRGTDIVLGGNPRGLAEQTIYKLVFSDILRSGDSRLDGIARIPLPNFLDGGDTLDHLPFSLVSNAHAAQLRSLSSEENFISMDDVENTMGGVMDAAERIKLLVMKELRPRMIKKWLRISDLDFERDIRSVIAKVIGEHEEVLEKESGLRQKLIETAAYAWLWYEQQCELCGDQVRDAGGLLVIGMSIAESQRIEDQLRGRAGRQGDPGDSIMLCDISDPMFRIWSFQGVAKVLKSNQQILNGKLEGYQANLIIKMLRSVPEKMSTRARRELREYDEVMEGFRSQLAYLRDIVMRGNHLQRTQMVYSWIQDMADGFVDKFCSRSGKPSSWKVFGVRRKEMFGVNLCGMVPETLEDCESIEEAMEMVFNPPNCTIALPISGIRKSLTPRLAQAVGMSKEELDELGLGFELQSPQLSDRATSNLKMVLVRVICFTKEIQDDLLESLRSGKPPVRSAAQYFGGHDPRQIITIELRHALSMHKEVLRQQKHESRKSIKGRNRKQLESLSLFLGELMIMLFEERKTQFIESLCQDDDHLLMDAQRSVEFRQKEVMLHLLDSYWANFLSTVKRLQASTTIRAFSRASPLEEFTIEASKVFNTTLEEYRNSAVLNLAAPQFNISPDSTYNMRRELVDCLRRDQKSQSSKSVSKQALEGDTQVADGDGSNDQMKSRSGKS